MTLEIAEQRAVTMMQLSFALGEMIKSTMNDAKVAEHYTKENKETCEAFWCHAESTIHALRELAPRLDRLVLIKAVGP